ncbi:MAG: hypothetical protein ACOYJJ_03830 [Anaerovoracaceae bacterium]
MAEETELMNAGLFRILAPKGSLIELDYEYDNSNEYEVFIQNSDKKTTLIIRVAKWKADNSRITLVPA